MTNGLTIFDTMSGSAAIRRYIRQHHLALLCLFLIVSGGTAWATHGEPNTISSEDIINSEVRNRDLGANAVGSGKVVDNSLTNADVADDTLTGADVADGALLSADLGTDSVGLSELAPAAVQSPEVSDGSLRAEDIGNNAVASAEVADDSLVQPDIGPNAVASSEVLGPLSNEDVDVFYAVVRADGTLNRSSGGVTSSRTDVGHYLVDFNRGISSCAYLGTTGFAGAAASVNTGEIAAVAYVRAPVDTVAVSTATSTGAASDKDFFLSAVC